jgi:hypothetical protein
MDLDELETLARACVAANKKVDAAVNAYARWDANQEAVAPHEDLGLHGAEVLALIARLRAAEATVEDLRAERALRRELHGNNTAEALLRAREETLDEVHHVLSTPYEEYCEKYNGPDYDVLHEGLIQGFEIALGEVDALRKKKEVKGE